MNSLFNRDPRIEMTAENICEQDVTAAYVAFHKDLQRIEATMESRFFSEAIRRIDEMKLVLDILRFRLREDQHRTNKERARRTPKTGHHKPHQM